MLSSTKIAAFITKSRNNYELAANVQQIRDQKNNKLFLFNY